MALLPNPQAANLKSEFFTYSTLFTSIANGVTQTQSVNIQADSFFTIQKLAWMADLAGAAVTASTVVVPLVKVLITDTGSGRQLMDQAIPLSTIFGTGQLPFILPTPRIIQPSSTLQVQVTNYSAATTYTNLMLAFIGAKTYTR